MHIASLVIYVRPDSRIETMEFLSLRPACTLYADESKAALVVVVEVDHESSINTLIDDLNARTGILSVNLVYHHIDSEHSLDQEITS